MKLFGCITLLTITTTQKILVFKKATEKLRKFKFPTIVIWETREFFFIKVM